MITNKNNKKESVHNWKTNINLSLVEGDRLEEEALRFLGMSGRYTHT